MRKIELSIALALFVISGSFASFYLLNRVAVDSELDDAVEQSVSIGNDPLGSVDDSAAVESVAAAADPERTAADQLALNSELELETAETDYLSRLLRQGDTSLLAGNYVMAAERYFQCRKVANVVGPAIELRSAFCLEQQGKFQRATERYARVINSPVSDTHRLLAFAGQARCMVGLGKPEAALEVLTTQGLQLARFSDVSESVKAQILFQSAKTIERLALLEAGVWTIADASDKPRMSSRAGNTNLEPNDLTKSNQFAFHRLVPPAEVFVDAVDNATQGGTVADDRGLGNLMAVVQRPSDSVKVISVDVNTSLRPVTELIGQLIATAGLELRMTPAAESALRGRSRAIALNSASISSILDLCLGSLDCVWFQVDSEVNVMLRSEVNASVGGAEFWFEAALRTFRQFELGFPDNELRNAALLSRGNLHCLQGRLDSAASLYQELQQANPRGETLAMLFLNQAKVQTLWGRLDEANRLLYLAADQTLDEKLESASYCLLGANLLAGGELAESIVASRRGLALAKQSSIRRFASLNLARAYILSQEPFAANQTLFRVRAEYDSESVSEGDPQLQMAAMLGAYSRFIGVTDDFNRRVAQTRLLTALTMTPDSSYSSFADAYVAGLAYERLGFRDEAIGMLIASLAKPDLGVWRRRILYELATLQQRGQQAEVATATLLSLTDIEDEFTWPALVQLAEIYLDTSQFDKFITLCPKLYREQLNETQKAKALTLLGKSYQLRGEHHSAALCFAGLLPEKQ